MSAKESILRSALLLGRVVPCLKENAAKIKVKMPDLDKRLLMFFAKYDFLYAHDPQKTSKVGDMVLIREMPVKLTKLITHEILRVVYPLGDITDPVTGKKVVHVHYREDKDHEVELYGGRIASTFVHNEAPPRGWQEDKRDLSHRESYIKWHEDGTKQKYAV